MGKKTLTIQYFDGSVEELPLDGKKITWIFARGKGIEKMQLDGEAFSIALEAMGGRVPDERMAEFVIALIAAQLGRESKMRETNAKVCGGRPSYPENVWARDQVHTHRRSPKEVYPEWLKRKRDRLEKNGLGESELTLIADLHDSFRKAIRLGRKNRKKPV